MIRKIISLKGINHTAQDKAERHPGAMNTPTRHNALKGHYQMKCGINKHELPLIIHELGHELVLIGNVKFLEMIRKICEHGLES